MVTHRSSPTPSRARVLTASERSMQDQTLPAVRAGSVWRTIILESLPASFRIEISPREGSRTASCATRVTLSGRHLSRNGRDTMRSRVV